MMGRMTTIPPRLLAGVFVIEQGPGTHDLGRRLRIEAGIVLWDASDREHRFLLAGPAEVDGDSLVIATEFGRWRCRPVREADSGWLAGRKGVGLDELRLLAASPFAWPA